MKKEEGGEGEIEGEGKERGEWGEGRRRGNVPLTINPAPMTSDPRLIVPAYSYVVSSVVATRKGEGE